MQTIDAPSRFICIQSAVGSWIIVLRWSIHRALSMQPEALEPTNMLQPFLALCGSSLFGLRPFSLSPSPSLFRQPAKICPDSEAGGEERTQLRDWTNNSPGEIESREILRESIAIFVALSLFQRKGRRWASLLARNYASQRHEFDATFAILITVICYTLLRDLSTFRFSARKISAVAESPDSVIAYATKIYRTYLTSITSEQDELSNG